METDAQEGIEKQDSLQGQDDDEIDNGDMLKAHVKTEKGTSEWQKLQMKMIKDGPKKKAGVKKLEMESYEEI